MDSGQEVLTWPDKTTPNVVDYDFNYTMWLLPPDPQDNADTIISSTWTVDVGDVAIALISFVSPITKVWVSGGSTGTAQILTNSIVTAQGRQWSQSGTFNVRLRNDQPGPL